MVPRRSRPQPLLRAALAPTLANMMARLYSLVYEPVHNRNQLSPPPGASHILAPLESNGPIAMMSWGHAGMHTASISTTASTLVAPPTAVSATGKICRGVPHEIRLP